MKVSPPRVACPTTHERPVGPGVGSVGASVRIPSSSSSDSSSCPIIRSERRPNSLRRSLAMTNFRCSISASRAASRSDAPGSRPRYPESSPRKPTQAATPVSGSRTVTRLSVSQPEPICEPRPGAVHENIGHARGRRADGQCSADRAMHAGVPLSAHAIK
jgi:hypothetical protein